MPQKSKEENTQNVEAVLARIASAFEDLVKVVKDSHKKLQNIDRSIERISKRV